MPPTGGSRDRLPAFVRERMFGIRLRPGTVRPGPLRIRAPLFQGADRWTSYPFGHRPVGQGRNAANGTTSRWEAVPPIARASRRGLAETLGKGTFRTGHDLDRTMRRRHSSAGRRFRGACDVSAPWMSALPANGLNVTRDIPPSRASCRLVRGFRGGRGGAMVPVARIGRAGPEPVAARARRHASRVCPPLLSPALRRGADVFCAGARRGLRRGRR